MTLCQKYLIARKSGYIISRQITILKSQATFYSVPLSKSMYHIISESQEKEKGVRPLGLYTIARN